MATGIRVGVADYGIGVWEGGLFDLEARLEMVQAAGYEGLERCACTGAEDAVWRACAFRRRGMDFATVTSVNIESSIRLTAAFGKRYVWTHVSAKDFDGFCRQVNIQTEACARLGVDAALHNHMGTLVETQEQVEAFLKRCPRCKLVLDTAHLAAVGGDPVAIVRQYPDRLAAFHLKDWLAYPDKRDVPNWWERGRFCELGAGNIGLDHAGVVRAMVSVGYRGWVFVEQDTHLQEPAIDLRKSRDFLRNLGL